MQAERLFASNHVHLNPTHEHSNTPGVYHAHNSQESVTSCTLENGQVVSVYESYHGDSRDYSDSSTRQNREHRKDSVYYQTFDVSYPNLTLVSAFEDPYHDFEDSDGLVTTGDDPAKRFDADGVDGILVNWHTVGNQRDPSVACFSDNRYVIAWQSNHVQNSNYQIYYSIYDTQHYMTLTVPDAVREVDVTAPDAGAHGTNLFPIVRNLGSHALIVWRHKQFDDSTAQNRTTVSTTVRGMLVDMATLAQGAAFDISDSQHPPEDYDYETGLVAVSDIDSSGRVGIIWTGDGYRSISGAFYQLLNGSMTTVGDIVDVVASDVAKYSTPRMTLLDDDTFLVSWLTSSQGETGENGQPLGQHIYGQKLSSSHAHLSPAVRISDVAFVADSSIAAVGDSLVHCYAQRLADAQQPTPYTTSDIHCVLLDASLAIRESFQANTHRTYPAFSQSVPVVTPVADATFMVQWESLNASEPLQQPIDAVPSSDDDLYYRLFEISV